MAQYEIKDANTANINEIFFDKNTNKLSYKNALGIVTVLEFTATPDKTYVGILTQTGTNNPLVAHNIQDFGQPSIVRDGLGTYSVNFGAGAMPLSKSYFSIVNGVNGVGIVTGQWVSSNLIRIYTYNTAGTLSDGILNNAQIVITVKP